MVLGDKTKTIIKATVPILESGGEILTKHFYKTMLTEYPEVVPFFNLTHQASGEQPRALARAVLMYAKNIDRLEALGPLVGEIVNKHVSLAVKAEHYPIVGTCLLRAMREVLGPETATDEVVGAWAEAYQQLADLLINAEEAEFQKIAATTGGWRGTREFVISKKVPESSEITSFYLAPADGKNVMAYTPGQYLCLVHKFPDCDIRRNYSLSALSNGSEYRISVKREGDGKMSNYLHGLNAGDKIDILPPAGEFVLSQSTKPLVLIAGGVGITPLLPMVQSTLANTSRIVHFVYAARNKEVQAFRDEISALAEKNSNLKCNFWYSKETGRFNKAQFNSWLPATPDFDAYFVGPKPFMRDVKSYLTEYGVPESQIHYEFFGPKSLTL